MKPFAGRGIAWGGALAAAILLAAASADVAAAAQVKKVAEKTFPFTASGEVVINSKNGRIAVESWDRSDVRVQITRVVRAGDAKQAEELLKGLRADVELTPG